MAASSRLTDGMSTSSAVRASRSGAAAASSRRGRPAASGGQAVAAEHVVELALVVAVAPGEALDHEHAGEANSPPAKVRGSGGADRHAPRRDHPRLISSPVSASMTGIELVRTQPP